MSESTRDETTTDFWERRYGEREHIWSGRPNDALVAHASVLEPGRALDLGCGEGADSVWLAGRGWRVTGVDISPTALDRAARHAAERGVPAGRIDWLATDLGEWRPDGSYELVSACFLLSPLDFPRTAVLRRAAAAVAPGGRLLVVSHGEFPPWAAGHDHGEHRFPSPEEELAELGLDPHGWTTEVCELAPREATGPDGERAVLNDTVVLLRRSA